MGSLFTNSITGQPPYAQGYSLLTPSLAPTPVAAPSPDAPAWTVDLVSLPVSTQPAMSPSPVGVFGERMPSLLEDIQRFFNQAMSVINGLFPPAPSPSPAPATQPAPGPGTHTTPAPPKGPTQATKFVISTFNVLGSSHTKPGAEKPNMASGPERIHSVVKLLAKHDVDVAGFQEFQGDQLKEFQKIAGNQYAVYPGFKLSKHETVNSIVWRKDTWELVKPGSIEIPYFNGKTQRMPVVRLRNKETGQEAYFANFHNPADTRRFHNQEKWRDKATDLQIELANRLTRETGLPVFITGDMNEREEYHHKMTSQAPMVAANDGPKGQAPKRMGIDWIFGSKGVEFSGYKKDDGALVNQASDHPMYVSQVTIGGT